MHINKYNLIRNLALLVIAGNMVGWLFPFPYVVWRVSLVLLALYVVLFESGKLLLCEKALLFFAIFNLLHFFVSLSWQTPSTTQIGNILCALLPFSLFVCLSEKSVITERFIFVMGIVLLITSILHYYHYERMALIMIGDEDTDITNNASVAFLMLLPLLFLMKNNIQKWGSLMVCIFFLVMGAKRGNLLAAVIPLVLFVYASLKNSRRAVLKTILVLAVIIGAAFITYHWVMNNEYLLYRVEKTQAGNSSGRDVIYSHAWHIWYDSDNFLQLLFGLGFDATLHHPMMEGLHAHCDWLEILVDYGLLGILLYLFVFIILALQIRKVKTFDLKMALLSSFFIWFFKSIYSMGFTGETLSVMMISMGTALGNYKRGEEIV